MPGTPALQTVVEDEIVGVHRRLALSLKATLGTPC